MHPSAGASGGVGWAALGDAGGSVVSQKLLGRVLLTAFMRESTPLMALLIAVAW